MGFIYKITNKLSGKSYIGETMRPNPETRWKQHIQKINKNKGCPALQDAVNKYGIENFKFDIIIICFDEDRFKYEKEYIEKYNSMVPNGYNILPGGEKGVSRLGIKASDETKKKISEAVRKFNKENPNHYETYKEKLRESMKKVDIGSAVKNSEAYKKAKEEGRVGARAHKDGKLSEETKKKIKDTLIKYYKNQATSDKHVVNVEKHREIMANLSGKKVGQYTKDGKLVKEYVSIASAGRETGVSKSNIQKNVSNRSLSAGGFVWKFIK
jgi:group I intron endonuclease